MSEHTLQSLDFVGSLYSEVILVSLVIMNFHVESQAELSKAFL